MVRAMNRYGAAALLVGLAVGVFAYRYGVLGFFWESPWKHVLTGGAIGLAIGASQLFRMQSEEVRRPGLQVLLPIGVVGALAGFGALYLAFPTVDRLSLERREFPGFSIAMPSGTTVENRTDYANGKVTIKDIGGQRGVVTVGWDLGEIPTQSDLQVMSELLVKAMGSKIAGRSMTTVAGPDGKAVDTIALDGEPDLLMSALACGGRYMMIATGANDSPRALHERIVKSFVCKPDPALEATAKKIFPLVIDLPGWYVLAEEPDQLQITDGTSLLMMRAQDAKLDIDPSIVVEGMFKAAGMNGSITGRHGKRVDIRIEDGSDQMNGWVRLVPCPNATGLVVALAQDQAALEMLDERVTKARCLGSNEPPQQWPAAPK